MKRLLLLLPLAGCVEEAPGIEGTQSLRVELRAPTEAGTVDDRLPDDARTVTIRVFAIDAQNEVDTSVSREVEVYAQFLGSLTPELEDAPLARVTLDAGVSADVAVELPAVFGPTLLWVQDPESYATGTSPTLWYRDPYVADVSTPEDEMALDALEASPLQEKQVAVTASRYGARGRLVVTGIYAQGYTVSDVECADADGTPPCTTGAYDHVLVFTFSRPRDERGRDVEVGQVIDGFAGAVQEFNGLTEIGFPQTFVAADDPVVDPAMIPAPDVIQASWLGATYELERRESALVAVEGGVVCELDDDYATYKQWKLDIGRGCGAPINVITAGVAELDPAAYVGTALPRVVGTLRPVNIGTFNVWIIYPRSADDVVLP